MNAAAGVAAFAARNGWPLLAEPHSNARRGPAALRCTDALLRSGFASDHAPDLVVVAGRAGLTRPLLAWLSSTPHVVLDGDGGWWDPTRSATAIVRCDVGVLADVDAPADADWLPTWSDAATRAATAVDAVLDESVTLTEPRVARDVAALVPGGSAVVVGSSMPVRDLDLTMRPRDDVRVVANRGVSGIDGFVSTAMGVALVHEGPTFALAGDLSLLHDSNGLVADDRPDLTLVVVNNDGGGIFSMLPQATGDAATFERLFGTPHAVDVRALCGAYDVAHEPVSTAAELADALAKPARDVRIVEVRTDRAANAALHERLRLAADTAIG
jgi:2-succinyl-5-enolpyruvyl-6-hydroxy-3-cyclohexene-1-carboxylate synthase